MEVNDRPYAVCHMLMALNAALDSMELSDVFGGTQIRKEESPISPLRG